MSMILKDSCPFIHLDLETNKAVLNEHAQLLFKDKQQIQEVIKKLNLNNKTDFIYISSQLYLVLILKNETKVEIFFIETKDKGTLAIHQDEQVDVDVYKKEVLSGFLEKFLLLKKRYGGFNIKFLYFKINFQVDLDSETKQKYLRKLLHYISGIIRGSDVLGQIDENSFGVILTNAKKDGAYIIVDKIIKLVNEINEKNNMKVIELYAALAHELFILQNDDFDSLVNLLEENSEFITTGRLIKELIK